jgi:hypothetical protein
LLFATKKNYSAAEYCLKESVILFDETQGAYTQQQQQQHQLNEQACSF